MTLNPALRLMAGKTPASSGPTFFDYYSMLREFWPEDPSWSAKPTDGGTITTIRDNGSLAFDLTASALGGGTQPTYQATGAINSKPCFEFHATSETVGGRASTVSGTVTTAFSVIVVGKFDTAVTVGEYFTSGVSGDVPIVGTLTNDWRGYHSSTLNVLAGTPDTSPHLFVFKVATNATQLWVDNTSQGTDTAGTIGSGSGFILGSANSNQALDGSIAYAAMYSGDITAATGYATWIADIASYYGLTLA